MNKYNEIESSQNKLNAREKQIILIRAFSFLKWFCPDHLREEIESKNSFGVMIGIFSNGLRASKSGSPVMMQSAFRRVQVRDTYCHQDRGKRQCDGKG